MVTINPALSMNATIVGGFGVDNMKGILPPNHFSILAEEAVNIIPDKEGKLREIMEYTLKPDFKFYLIETMPINIPQEDEKGNDILITPDPNESAYELLTSENIPKFDEPANVGYDSDDSSVGIHSFHESVFEDDEDVDSGAQW